MSETFFALGRFRDAPVRVGKLPVRVGKLPVREAKLPVGLAELSLRVAKLRVRLTKLRAGAGSFVENFLLHDARDEGTRRPESTNSTLTRGFGRRSWHDIFRERRFVAARASHFSAWLDLFQ